MKRFSKIKTDHADADKRISKLDEDQKIFRKEVYEIKSELKSKTYNDETLRIWKHFNNYAEYTDLKDLYNKVLP
jgi:hypothetical protein